MQIAGQAILRTAYDMGKRGDVEFEDAISRASGGQEPDERPALDGAARRQALLDAAAAAEDEGRLEALHATGLLDSDISPSFDRLARLAAHVASRMYCAALTPSRVASRSTSVHSASPNRTVVARIGIRRGVVTTRYRFRYHCGQKRCVALPAVFGYAIVCGRRRR